MHRGGRRRVRDRGLPAAARLRRAARAAGAPPRGRGLLDRHHEPRPAVRPRVRAGRLPRPDARRRRAAGDRGRRPERASRARPGTTSWSPIPFWANTQLLWYRKSVAEAAGLDMTQPVTWDQLIAGGPGPGQAPQRPGHPRRVADGVAQRARSSPPAAHHRGERRRPRRTSSSASTPTRPQRAAEVMRDVADVRRSAGRLLDRRARTPTPPSSRATDAGFMVNWPFVWAAGARRRRGRHAGAVGARRLRLDALPAGRRGHAVRAALGGINLGVGGVQPARGLRLRGHRVHHQRREPGVLLRSPTATRRRPPRSTTTRRCRRPSRWRRPSGSPWSSAAPRPQTPYYSEVSGGLQREYHPPALGRSRADRPGGRRPDHAVLRGDQLL